MDIFIDTNVFLSFYYLTSDDLEELNKLAVLLQNKNVTLWLPEQVVIEFRRNRDNKIAEALKSLRDQKFNLHFPAMCKDYEEYNELRKLLIAYDQKHSKLIDKIKNDVANEDLKADDIISRLFNLAKRIDSSEEIVNRARMRHEIGNPPGKRDSLGDAINWETLLNNIPNGKILYFIADDKDYYSPLNDQQFNSFLSEEWSSKKNSQLRVYRKLSIFFRDHFPNIKLATELEKDLLIRDFANSGSFAQTHIIVAKLNKYAEFTPPQINDIVAAAISNGQIAYIIDDEDVKQFMERVINGQEDKIDQESLKRLKQMINPSTITIEASNENQQDPD